MAETIKKSVGSKIEILVSCQSLKDKDMFSKSDPCCVLFLEKDGMWHEIGRTEVIKNSINPQFTKAFDVDYFFEETQRRKFAIYDIDNKSAKLTDDDFLGAIECTVGEIVNSGTYTKPLILKNGKTGKATIFLRANEANKVKEVLLLQFSASKIDKKDVLSKSDPFLEFHRVLHDGQLQTVYRTDVVKNDLSPTWNSFEVHASRLCGDDIKTKIRSIFAFNQQAWLLTKTYSVDCLDYESKGSHEIIGSFETSVAQLISGQGKELKWPLINPKKKSKKKNYENSGIITLNFCEVSKSFTFLDYVFGGLQINFTVGVDFTASNGSVTNPQSLHFLSHDQPNPYIRAIRSVGDVIKDYDSDQMFPALGYGAKIPPLMEVSHSFALNFNASNPFCSGIGGVLEAYRTCLSQIELYGPTNFSPIILHVAQFAAAAQKESGAKNYFVLLIITDGVISDLPETLRAIVYASSLPFSIIIVGVGSADFKIMDILDGDGEGELKDDRGNVAKRDIVQFVAFRDFEDNMEKLTKKVLSEVPDQICQYFKMNDIYPSDRPAAVTSIAEAESIASSS